MGLTQYDSGVGFFLCNPEARGSVTKAGDEESKAVSCPVSGRQRMLGPGLSAGESLVGISA